MNEPRDLRFKNRRRILALGLSLALFATACGSDTSDAATAGSDAGAETTNTEQVDEPAGDEVSETADVDDSSTRAETDGATTDITKFIDGALAEDIATVDCTLPDGKQTSCYQITIAGYPADGDIGPFCPTTTSDTADDVGIWLDGENVYDIDGEFILDLPEIYNDENWHLHDDEGNVFVTDTQEAFEGAARPDVAEEYQNHCVEGQIAWLENGEPITSTVEIPVTPTATGAATQSRGSLGVTLNGVIIDGEAPIAAILGAYTIAAFDDCGGHVNPFAGYHMHGATGCSEVGDASDGETPAFGIAMDGYAIHSPLDPADVADAGLDQCNGHTTNELGYHYHANQPEDNAVLSCLTGATSN